MTAVPPEMLIVGPVAAVVLMATHSDVPLAGEVILTQYCVLASRPVKVCDGLDPFTPLVDWMADSPDLHKANLLVLLFVVIDTVTVFEVDDTVMSSSSQWSLVVAAQGAVAASSWIKSPLASETRILWGDPRWVLGRQAPEMGHVYDDLPRK